MTVLDRILERPSWTRPIRVDFDSCETTLEKPTHAEQKIAEIGIDFSNSTDSLEQSVIKQIVNEQKIQHEGDPRFMCMRRMNNLMPVGEMDTAIKYLSQNEYRKFRDKILKEKNKSIYDSMIQRVIFNPPATIVIWKDGSKTVVKCGKNDIFDPEKGLAMAISKRAFGDNRDYYEVFAKWVGKYEYQQKKRGKKP